MNDDIKITEDLIFDFEDLMLPVNFEHEFTLRDVLRASVNSAIPIEILSVMLRCNYIEDYWAEAESKPFDDKSDIEYLELYYWVTKHTFEGKRDDGSCWGFHGIGKEGVIPEDIIEHSTEEEIQEMRDEGYRQAYAVEFTPMYKLADYPIRIGDKIHVTDYDAHPKDILDRDIDVIPTITLMELLYWIFWELSFLGSLEERDDKGEGLKQIVDDIKEGKAELTPWEEIKTKLEDKFKKE
jgi:hypothetical protein